MYVRPTGSTGTHTLFPYTPLFRAHDRKAMRQVGGKGLTDALAAEVDLALEHHELIKVKVGSDDRDARDTMIAELAGRVDAALVQRIGHTAEIGRAHV